MLYLKYLFEQQYNIMLKTVFGDDFIVLCHSKVNIRKVDGCSIKHLDVLVVQLLHTHINKNTHTSVIQTIDNSHNTSEKLEN